MIWRILAAIAVIVAVAVHFWWRARSSRIQEELRREIARLKEEQRGTAAQIANQQAALFDSMAEGLLILDENGRIQHANRAFVNLFDITNDLQSRSVLEALRLHELSELVN